jgi:hypothetical protein
LKNATTAFFNGLLTDKPSKESFLPPAKRQPIEGLFLREPRTFSRGRIAFLPAAARAVYNRHKSAARTLSQSFDAEHGIL